MRLADLSFGRGAMSFFLPSGSSHSLNREASFHSAEDPGFAETLLWSCVCCSKTIIFRCKVQCRLVAFPLFFFPQQRVFLLLILFLGPLVESKVRAALFRELRCFFFRLRIIWWRLDRFRRTLSSPPPPFPEILACGPLQGAVSTGFSPTKTDSGERPGLVRSCGLSEPTILSDTRSVSWWAIAPVFATRLSHCMNPPISLLTAEASSSALVLLRLSTFSLSM